MAKERSQTSLVDTVFYYLCVGLALGLMVIGYLGPEEYLGKLGDRLISWLMQ
jgi:hypothetical protein